MVSYSDVTFLEMAYNTFLRWSRLWTNNKKLLAVLYQQINKLIELTEWWVCYDYIIVAVVNVLKAYTLISLGIVTAHANRTDAPFLSLVQQIVNELAFDQVHSFLYFLTCLGNVDVFDSTFCTKQVSLPNTYPSSL